MRIAIVVLAAAFAGACSTTAPEPKAAEAATTGQATVQKTAAQKTTDKEDRVCKRFKPTGSNMPQSVCRSKEEWAAIEKRDRESADELSRDMRSVTTSRP